MSKYLMVVILLACAGDGWYLWHMKDADFMNAWVGSMVFFCCLFCALVILAVAPNYLPFG